MGRRGSRSAYVVGAGVVMLACAVGAQAASGGQPSGGTQQEFSSGELLYHCDTGDGSSELRVRFALSLPEAASDGMIGVTVNATLGEQVVADLAAEGAPEVTGVLSATTLVKDTAADDDEQGTPVLLPDLSVPSTPLPSEGALTLTATGEAAELTGGPGEYSVSAGRFSLLLGWQPPPSDPGDGAGGGDTPDPGEPGAGGEPNSETPPASTENGGGGAAAAARQSPPARAFDCEPASGQNTLITVLSVAGDGSTEPGGEPGKPDPRGSSGERSGESSGDGERIGASAQPKDVPQDCIDFAGLNNAWCAYLGGYTNIDRMGAAARIEPGIVNLGLPFIGPCNDGSEWYWFCQTAVAELRHDGKKQLPPTKNSFHAFGFMPNAATIELTQVGDMRIDVRTQVVAPYDGSVVAHATLSVRLDDVTVNGVELDVGPDCRTQEPITVALTADYPGDYTPATGGFLDGYTDIPPFSGCGVGEDLDPLLTGLISGKDNYVKMTQGRICDIRTGQYCPPVPPELQR